MQRHGVATPRVEISSGFELVAGLGFFERFLKVSILMCDGKPLGGKPEKAAIPYIGIL